MGRPLRVTKGGLVYHVLNRANARMPIFEKAEDFDAFTRVLSASVARFKMRLLSYCVMPNHWHLVVWPRHDGELSSFVGWLTLTHTQRWHAHRGSVGCGHVYQGRFKSFTIEADEHLWTVCRYVERNPLRADLCEKAELWRWSSLAQRMRPDDEEWPQLSPWPIERPADWLRRVNVAETAGELEALRRASKRGQPFGGEAWVARMTKRHGLQSAFRPHGRPRTEKP